MARFLPRLFYGWWIVLAGTVAQVLQGGLYLYGFSLFFMPLLEEFGWTRAALAAVFSCSRLEGGFLGPLQGWLVDKYGPRRIMLVGVPIMATGFFLMSLIDSFWVFTAIFFFFIATGSTLGLVAPCYTAVGNWFIKRRGTAMGLLSMGTGLGGASLLLLAWVINNYGWRAGAIAGGVTVLALGMPMVPFMRHRPEQYGCLPDGIEPDSRTDLGPAEKERPKQICIDEVNFGGMAAMRTPAFWMLMMAFAIRQMSVGAVTVHLIPFFIGIGISPEMAASLLAGLSFLSIAGRLGFGWLADKFDKRYVMASTLVLMMVAMFMLVGVQDVGQAIVWVLIYAPAYGGGSPLMPALRGEFFGRKAFGTIQGNMQAFQMWGLVIGPMAAGYAYDMLGSYHLAFLIFGVANLAGIAFLVAARRPRLGGPALIAS